jgi:hypothetical protein
MVFEATAQMIEEINIFGMGIYILVLAIWFGIARGLTKDKKDIFIYFIIIGAFGTILLFSGDFIKTFIFLATALAIIIYGLNYLRSRSKE